MAYTPTQGYIEELLRQRARNRAIRATAKDPGVYIGGTKLTRDPLELIKGLGQVLQDYQTQNREATRLADARNYRNEQLRLQEKQIDKNIEHQEMVDRLQRQIDALKESGVRNENPETQVTKRGFQIPFAEIPGQETSGSQNRVSEIPQQEGFGPRNRFFENLEPEQLGPQNSTSEIPLSERSGSQNRSLTIPPSKRSGSQNRSFKIPQQEGFGPRNRFFENLEQEGFGPQNSTSEIPQTRENMESGGYTDQQLQSTLGVLKQYPEIQKFLQTQGFSSESLELALDALRQIDPDMLKHADVQAVTGTFPGYNNRQDSTTNQRTLETVTKSSPNPGWSDVLGAVWEGWQKEGDRGLGKSERLNYSEYAKALKPETGLSPEEQKVVEELKRRNRNTSGENGNQTNNGPNQLTGEAPKQNFKNSSQNPPPQSSLELNPDIFPKGPFERMLINEVGSPWHALDSTQQDAMVAVLEKMKDEEGIDDQTLIERGKDLIGVLDHFHQDMLNKNTQNWQQKLLG